MERHRTTAKFEIAADEEFNPIKQDIKKGQLRYVAGQRAESEGKGEGPRAKGERPRARARARARGRVQERGREPEPRHGPYSNPATAFIRPTPGLHRALTRPSPSPQPALARPSPGPHPGPRPDLTQPTP